MSDAAAPTSSACPGCGAVLADGPGPESTRPGASPACVRLLEDTLRGLRDDAAADPGAAATLRLAEDTYAAQHPDPSAPDALQAVLERLGVRSGRHSAPPPAWQTTIADVAADLDVIDLPVLVDRWAETVVADWAGVPLRRA
jgi:hypothetical protein